MANENLNFNALDDKVTTTTVYKKYFEKNIKIYANKQEAIEYMVEKLLPVVRYQPDYQTIIFKGHDQLLIDESPMKLSRFSLNYNDSESKTTIPKTLNLLEIIDTDSRFFYRSYVNEPSINYEEHKNPTDDVINIFQGWGVYSDDENIKNFQIGDMINIKDENKDEKNKYIEGDVDLSFINKIPDEDVKWFLEEFILKVMMNGSKQNFRHFLYIIDFCLKEAAPLEVMVGFYSKNGGNGKSELLKFLDTCVFGFIDKENRRVRRNVTFLNNAKELSSNFMDVFIGKQVMMIDEMNSINKKKKAELDFDIIKSFLTAYIIRATRKGKVSIEFMNALKLFVSTNNIDYVKYISTAIFRRVWTINTNPDYCKGVMDAKEHYKFYNRVTSLIKSFEFQKKVFTILTTITRPDNFRPANYPIDDFQIQLKIKDISFNDHFFMEFINPPDNSNIEELNDNEDIEIFQTPFSVKAKVNEKRETIPKMEKFKTLKDKKDLSEEEKKKLNNDQDVFYINEEQLKQHIRNYIELQKMNFVVTDGRIKDMLRDYPFMEKTKKKIGDDKNARVCYRINATMAREFFKDKYPEDIIEDTVDHELEDE